MGRNAFLVQLPLRSAVATSSNRGKGLYIGNVHRAPRLFPTTTANLTIGASLKPLSTPTAVSKAMGTTFIDGDRHVTREHAQTVARHLQPPDHNSGFFYTGFRANLSKGMDGSSQMLNMEEKSRPAENTFTITFKNVLEQSPFGGLLQSTTPFTPYAEICDEDSDPFCMFAGLYPFADDRLAPYWPINETSQNFSNGIFPKNGSVTWPSEIGSSNDDILALAYWTLLLSVFPMFTVFGNLLVVMSVVRERSLKTVTNYFICSLAVADILVAVVVMPFAVYVEFAGGWWLSDLLCDAWVASDVMACTASILNLTAISVDRFIAVTQPIKYAKHKNSQRVYIMIGVTWIISVAIAMPISLGVNYSPDRITGDCAFYNANFIIYSSMGSFYIPSLIMMLLYWKIYRVIRLRARKAFTVNKRNFHSKTVPSVIENRAATGVNTCGSIRPVEESNRNNGDAGKSCNDESIESTKSSVSPQPTQDAVSVLTTSHVARPEPTVKTVLAPKNKAKVISYNTTSSALLLNLSRTDNDTCFMDSTHDSVVLNDKDISVNERILNNVIHPFIYQSRTNNIVDCVDVHAKFIVNPKAELCEEKNKIDFDQSKACSGNSGSPIDGPTEAAPVDVSVSNNGAGRISRQVGELQSSMKTPLNTNRKRVSRFHFTKRHSHRRKDKSSSRRERKATKTLAIVLCAFLLCWMPFFTYNNIIAICIQYDLHQFAVCAPNKIIFSIFAWLGYINSVLNPVIYTIFNPEFRKAFQRILRDFSKCNFR